MTENPYADAGGTIVDDRFIGRDDELRQIRSRVLGTKGSGSVAVVGLPRIGKTSLVARALALFQQEQAAESFVVARIQAGACRDGEDLFLELVREIRLRLEERSRFSQGAAAACDHAAAAQGRLRCADITAVFRQLNREGIRTVCVIDEFDSVRNLFVDYRQGFHWLRELASVPEAKTALVLISKRPLAEVARLAGTDSDYWANVLAKITVRPFSQSEREAFYEKLRSNGVNLGPGVREEVTELCGGHPFLLSSLAFHAWEALNDGRDLGEQWFIENVNPFVREYYKQAATVLKDVDMLEKVFQVVSGPQWSVTRNDIDDMIHYGVLQTETREGANCTESFAAGFGDYLEIAWNDAQMWPIWRETEIALRNRLETQLSVAFGVDWQAAFVAAFPKLASMFQECRKRMEQDVSRFGGAAGGMLLAYTYPQQLYDIMACNWSRLGEPLLGPDKAGWSVKFSVLSKVRTPVAHNRDYVVSDAERQQAHGICREILGRMGHG